MIRVLITSVLKLLYLHLDRKIRSFRMTTVDGFAFTLVNILQSLLLDDCHRLFQYQRQHLATGIIWCFAQVSLWVLFRLLTSSLYMKLSLLQSSHQDGVSKMLHVMTHKGHKKHVIFTTCANQRVVSSQAASKNSAYITGIDISSAVEQKFFLQAFYCQLISNSS